ncbi:hypothetical protein AMATHDRAFT_3176 [Amanita thiersii Skay4041]|uniref:Major facilitator superfamily (MFS) profile domain-containing protein n=1 Tax=Amanita thiersii Skay4041 TaxID=703135 RepID=A0A2A9NST0_9AGAR|nr:hypothetical protein AMATHDRAFT_3176 [Amanita thiersii Skay4041]
MTHPVDEATPLLRSQQVTKTPPTPLPWGQITIVLLLQLAEPLCSQVIYPFAPELIRSLGITGGNEKRVGYYVGIMQSVFFLTEAFTVLHWSRLSDRIGRKPVILSGLIGLSLSMYCFGLSTTFWGLLLSRSMNGALNGNIGVIRSMMVELTDESNISRAYAFMPLAWSTGATVGPVIGGSLSRPAERFPYWFGNSELLKRYPYLLPCAIPAAFTALAWVMTFIFLKETVKRPTPISQFFSLRRDKSKLKLQHIDYDEEGCVQAIKSITTEGVIRDDDKHTPLRSVITPQVLIAASNYASLSLVEIAFRAIQPVFFSTPIEDGGLGLSPAQIGNILSAFGIMNGLFQVFWFARIHDVLGSKKTFTIGLASTFPLFASFPLMNYIARIQGYSMTLWIAVLFHVIISIMLSFSYGAVFIIIANAAPNRETLGSTNGLCQMLVSFMRAVGPALANSLYSVSIDQGYLGGNLVYYTLMGLTGGALYIASLLPRNRT